MIDANKALCNIINLYVKVNLQLVGQSWTTWKLDATCILTINSSSKTKFIHNFGSIKERLTYLTFLGVYFKFIWGGNGHGVGCYVINVF
jgi:hypothetical protein